MSNTFKPILFSTPMVQAILNGTKTQTRRILSPQPYKEEDWLCDTNEGPIKLATFIRHPKMGKYDGVFLMQAPKLWPAKYQVGDILWVRETWQYLDIKEDWNDELADYNYMICYTYKASNDLRPNGVSAEEFCGNWVVSTEERWNNADYSIESEEVEGRDVWKPSIHMPKEAARIFLKVTNVRCERLNDITEADAIAEGIIKEKTKYGDFLFKHYLKDKFGPSAKHSFQTLWQKINGLESWEQNPYVWVYEFEKINKPLDFIKNE